MSEFIHAFSPDSLGDLLRVGGYRAESSTTPTGAPILRSAAGGLAFEVHFSNPIQGSTDRFLDATFVAGVQVKGEFPLDVVNRWNGTKRFARLLIGQGHLLLQMDVVVAGGVSRDHLRAHVEIWDRLIQELLVFLRVDANRGGQSEALAS